MTGRRGVVGLVLAFALAGWTALSTDLSVVKAQQSQSIGQINVKAGVVELNGNTVRLSGNPRPQVWSSGGLQGSFDVRGDSITLILNPKARTNFDRVKQISAVGSAVVERKSPPDKSLRMTASKLVVEMNLEAKSGKDMVNSAVATGPVVADSKALDQSAHVTAAAANYSRLDQVVVFTGNVKVAVTSKQVPKPTYAAGAKLTLWQGSKQQAQRVLLEGSSENSPATLQITPPEDLKVKK